MEMFIYKFATLDDGLVAVENQAMQLEIRERHGEALAPEERDWLDWANSVSLTANQHPVHA